MNQVPSNSTAQASLRLIRCLSSPFQILLIQKSFLIHLIDSLLLHVFLGFTYSICSANWVLFLSFPECQSFYLSAFPFTIYHPPSPNPPVPRAKPLSLHPLYLPKASHWSLEIALSTEVFKHYSARIYFK